jgi:hypothetical protein
MLISKLITPEQYEIASAVQIHVNPLDNTLFILPVWEEEEIGGREGDGGKEESEIRDGAVSSSQGPL